MLSNKSKGSSNCQPHHHVRNDSESEVTRLSRGKNVCDASSYSPVLMGNQGKTRAPSEVSSILTSSWKPHLKESSSFSAPNSGSKFHHHPTISSWISFSQKLSHGISLSASWAGHNLLGGKYHHSEDDSPSYLLGRHHHSNHQVSFFSSSVFYDGLPVTSSGVVDILKLPADEVAAQLTLIDLPIFQSISREELLSIEWNNNVKKYTCTPNIVAFTRRFNQISFWVIEQVLLADKNSKKSKKAVDRQLSFSKAIKDGNHASNVNGNMAHSMSVTSSPSMSKSKWHRSLSSSNLIHFSNHVTSGVNSNSVTDSDAKSRAHIIAYFIKVAKRLLEMNNLHSCYAILSALNSSPIYRLNKTWSHVSKKDKTSFDKMVVLFSDDSNFEHLRLHLSKTENPCIPYLGMFLRDLVYVDIAHPAAKQSKSLCKTSSTSSTSSLSSSSLTNHYYEDVNDVLSPGIDVTEGMTTSPKASRNTFNGFRLDSSNHHHHRVKDDIASSMSINTTRVTKLNKILESVLKYQSSYYGKCLVFFL